MADKIEDAQKRVDEANQKAADAKPGNVVSQVSAFGTPSTYEDPNHPEGKAIAQLDEERTQDVDKFNDDQASVEKAQEAAADEAVKAAEQNVVVAEGLASDDAEASRQASADVQAANEKQAEKVRTAIQQAGK